LWPWEIDCELDRDRLHRFHVRLRGRAVGLLLRSVLPKEHLGTLIAAFFVCALSVFGAIFVILELDRRSKGCFRFPAPRYAQP
jgi:hypothetical protein